MPAGALGHRGSVQTRTEVSDGHDAYTETWTTIRSRIPAKVKPLQGRDLELARQADPRISHEVTIRFWGAYQMDLDGGRARFVFHPTSNSADDRTFEMIGPPVDVDEQNLMLQLLCREVQ